MRLAAKAAHRDAAALQRIRALHTPFDNINDTRSPWVEQRCRGCIGGYDPATGELLHCAYPCPTIRAMEGTNL